MAEANKQALLNPVRQSWKHLSEHPDCKIQLQVIRSGAVIVPTVSAPKRSTTKLYMVLDPMKNGKTL